MNFYKLLSFFFFSVALFSQARAQENPGLTKTERMQVIDSVSRALQRNYVYPEKGRELARMLEQKLKKGAFNAINSKPQFANLLTRELRALIQDNHLGIRFDPDLEKRIRSFVSTSQLNSKDADKEKGENYFFRKVEILKGNIGYIVFTGFADTNEGARRAVRAAMNFVSNTDALILDLRNNFGGRAGMVGEILNYFFSKPTLTGRTCNRIQDTWTEEWVIPRPSVTEGLTLTMPLYILTSERTFSAAESLSYVLQHLRNASIVGDTTRGGAHATRSFALGNGFVAFIPFTRGENIITEKDWEGSGVIPTISCNEDSAFYIAQEQIMNFKLSKTSDSTELRKLHWLLNDLLAKQKPLTLSSDILNTYTGSFEEFLFTLENGRLYCTNVHQRNKKDALIAIRSDLFKIDEQSQVQFIKNEKGLVESIVLFWNDGWVDFIKKSR